MVYSTEKFLADNDDKLADDLKAEVQGDVDALKTLLEDEEAGTEALTAGISKLGESSQKLGAAMYAEAGAADAAGEPGAEDATAGSGEDDVVDAEIVEEEPGTEGTDEGEKK